MSEGRAIVTLTLGEKVQQSFDRWFRPAWEAYCQRHGLKLIVLRDALDHSERAAARSPAWQKCLVHTAPALVDAGQIAWVDADVMINPLAPDIFKMVPEERIGAVDDFATPNREDHDILLDRLYRRWDETGIRYVDNKTPQRFYANFGIACDFDSVVQTGVMVFSPSRHGSIFEKTYRDYEAAPDKSLNHEMRPLSYEILKSGAVQWLNPKFNMQWSYYQQLYYPFLDDGNRSSSRWKLHFTGRKSSSERVQCVRTAFGNNHFLHFAGGSRDYELISS